MQPSTKSVSVIIPCYNGAPFLRETLESARNQTVPPLEIIVIDDGSTDESAAIAESFGEPVRVIRQENQGESVARNLGVREALGDFIFFLDADDLIAPESLERLLNALQGTSGSVGIMKATLFHEDSTKPFAKWDSPPASFFPGIISTNFGPPHCWLFPRSIVTDLGGFAEEIQWSEDWHFFARVALSGVTLVPIDYEGALYRRHPNSQVAMGSDTNKVRGHIGVLMAFGKGMLVDRPDLLQEHGEVLFWCMWAAIRRGRTAGLSWNELSPLSTVMVKILKNGPANLRASRLGRLIRLLGVRWAMRIKKFS